MLSIKYPILHFLLPHPLVHLCKMWKIPKNRAFSILLIYLFIIVDVRGRPLGFNGYPHELVSDGVDEGEGQKSSVLVLRGMEYSSEECEQLYGFLPCSNNILGHLFLIVVYEYLMFHGESYVASGGEQIFKILGPGVFGASVFQVLGALPESLILLGKFSQLFAMSSSSSSFFFFFFFFFIFELKFTALFRKCFPKIKF